MRFTSPHKDDGQPHLTPDASAENLRISTLKQCASEVVKDL